LHLHFSLKVQFSKLGPRVLSLNPTVLPCGETQPLSGPSRWGLFHVLCRVVRGVALSPARIPSVFPPCGTRTPPSRPFAVQLSAVTAGSTGSRSASWPLPTCPTETQLRSCCWMTCWPLPISACPAVKSSWHFPSL
jgi:hypothetical protein